jgi:chaperonin GroES
MKLVPLGDRVILKRIEKEDQKTAGGIVLPDSAKEKPTECEVVAVGPGKLDDGKRITPDVKVGDKVIIAKWGGTEIKIEGIEYVIVNEDDIMAKLEKK